MFCVHCGAGVEPAHQYCGSCGKAVGMAAQPGVMRAASPSTTEQHLPILGVLWMIRGALRLAGAAALLFVGNALFPWLAGWTHEPMEGFVSGFIPGILRLSAMAAGLVGLGSVAVGYALLQKESWGRPLALVMAFLALLSIPFGTALGIYTLWVLLPARSEEEYRRLAGVA